LIHGIRAQAHRHAFPRTHRVDDQRERRHGAVDGGFLEQQCFASAGRFHFAIGQFGDFQFGADRLGNAFQFPGAVKGVDEIAEGIKGHTGARLTESRHGENR